MIICGFAGFPQVGEPALETVGVVVSRDVLFSILFLLFLHGSGGRRRHGRPAVVGWPWLPGSRFPGTDGAAAATLGHEMCQEVNGQGENDGGVLLSRY